MSFNRFYDRCRGCVPDVAETGLLKLRLYLRPIKTEVEDSGVVRVKGTILGKLGQFPLKFFSLMDECGQP